MNRRLRVAVAMCTRDGEAHLGEQLRSIAEQSRKPDELVVCDDASRESTMHIVDAFMAEAPFPVRVERNRVPLGVTANFARAIALCDADVICPSDQDDRWRSHKLERIAHEFERDETVGLVFSDLVVTDEELRPLGHTQWQLLGLGPASRGSIAAGETVKLLLRFNLVTGAAMAFRADLRELALPIPSGWIYDEWLALLAAATCRVVAIEEALVDYRRHERQRIGPAKAGIRIQLAHARERMGPEYFEAMARRFEAARERLAAVPERLRDRGTMADLEAKVAHAQRRKQMREPGVWRLPLVLSELYNGGYHRFGYGWKSLGQDLLL